MKALICTGPERLDFRDAAEPGPGNDEVLVRVEACGICGFDRHAYRRLFSPKWASDQATLRPPP